MEFKIHLCMFCVRLTFMKQKRPGFVLLKFWCNINIGRVTFVQQLQNYYFKHILLFNNKQLDRTQVSQLRKVFSKSFSSLYWKHCLQSFKTLEIIQVNKLRIDHKIVKQLFR